MPRGEYLGEFEQIVMLAAARLGDESYGMAIRRAIADRIGRDVSIGAVYATLDRLELKGLVRPGESQSGGRARRFFIVTRAGLDALEASRQIHARMWAGLRLRRATRR
jgi:DNA-binding PadR family transcriptional regulator